MATTSNKDKPEKTHIAVAIHERPLRISEGDDELGVRVLQETKERLRTCSQ